MSRTRRNMSLAALAALGVSAALASCGGSTSTETGSDGGALPTNTTRVVTTGTRSPTADCSPEPLAKASAAKFPDATVRDNVCDLSWAIATIFPKDGPKQGVVGFYQASAGEWTFVKDVATSADLGAEAPTGFPGALLQAWTKKYVDPTKPSTTTTQANSGGGGSGGGGSGGSCVDGICPSTTAAPTTTAKPTTTTAKPTTTTPKAVATSTETPQTQTIIIKG